ncbi:MAG: hypothetical protein GTN69_12330 [Armatimonadetes bacterium]|nr:hypothetical protein [Armatimonadota bacterium]
MELYDDPPPLQGVLGQLSLVHKARLDPLDPNDFDRIVASLSAQIIRTAGKVEREALNAWIRRLKFDWPTATDAQLLAASKSLNAAMRKATGDVWAGVRGTLQTTSQRTAGDTRKSQIRTDKLEINAVMNLTDRRAVARMTATNVHYIRDYYGRVEPSMSARMREVAAEGIEQGLGTTEIARNIRREVGGTLKGLSNAYYNVVSNAVCMRSRTFSQLGSFRDAGIERFVFDAVLDEVTTDTCFVAGTLIRTPDGERPIEAICPGDLVFTAASGLRAVRATRIGHTGELLTITTLSGRHLTVTANHPILTNHGWTRSEDIRPGHFVSECKLRALQGGVHFQAARRQMDEVLLPPVLLRLEKTPYMGRTGLRALREKVQGTTYIRRTRSVPLLFNYVQEGRQSQGRRPKAMPQSLRRMRAGLHNFTGGIPSGKNTPSLLQGLSAQTPIGHLRLLWRRVRDLTYRSRTEALLLKELLSQIKDAFASSTVDLRDTERLWDRLRGREGVRSPRRQKENGLRGLLADRSWYRHGVRRCLLARPEAQRQGGEQESQIRSRRGRAIGSHPLGGHQEKTLDLPLAAYFSSVAKYDRVVNVSRHSVPITPVYNLQIDGNDPTYVAAGLIVHNCRFLHGTVFSVAAGLARYEAADKLRDPTAIDSVMPWTTERVIQSGEHEGKTGVYIRGAERLERVFVVERSGVGAKDRIGTYSNALSPNQLTEKGLGYPPLHMR